MHLPLIVGIVAAVVEQIELMSWQSQAVTRRSLEVTKDHIDVVISLWHEPKQTNTNARGGFCNQEQRQMVG